MGDVDAVHSMLHNNAASLVNEPSSMSTLLTPLHVACEHGDTALIEVGEAKYPPHCVHKQWWVLGCCFL